MRSRISRYVRLGQSAAIPVMAAVVAGLLAGAALGAGPYSISQKDREFKPREISIKRGEALRFINDDGELLHHGSKFEVAFPAAGNFTVLCAIHPKMRLLVHVAN